MVPGVTGWFDLTWSDHGSWRLDANSGIEFALAVMAIGLYGCLSLKTELTWRGRNDKVAFDNSSWFSTIYRNRPLLYRWRMRTTNCRQKITGRSTGIRCASLTVFRTANYFNRWTRQQFIDSSCNATSLLILPLRPLGWTKKNATQMLRTLSTDVGYWLQKLTISIYCG